MFETQRILGFPLKYDINNQVIKIILQIMPKSFYKLSYKLFNNFFSMSQITTTLSDFCTAENKIFNYGFSEKLFQQISKSVFTVFSITLGGLKNVKKQTIEVCIKKKRSTCF